jgi:hypothetical protein
MNKFSIFLITLKRFSIRTWVFANLLIRGNKINFQNQLSNAQVLNLVKNDNKSIIRWGDGETNFYFYGSTASQSPNHIYVSELRGILDQYSSDSNYILCIPSETYLNIPRNRSFKSPWRDTASLLSIKMSQSVEFGESFIFRKSRESRHMSDLDSQIEELMIMVNSIVESRERIFLLSSQANHLDLFNEKAKQKVCHILTLRKNGLEDIENIFGELDTKYSPFSSGDIFLISAGILGKLICLRLSDRGLTAVDVGGSLKMFENAKRG